MSIDVADAAKILEPHWPEIEKQFEVLSARFAWLSRTDHEPMGRVLKSHLIIESFMGTFLDAQYPNSDIEGARLSFYQKASLLPHNSCAEFVKAGILQLNSVRNKFSHRLDHIITSAEISAIEHILSIARPSRAAQTPIDAIESFTPVACAFLDVPPQTLKQVFMQAFRNTPY